MRKVFQARSTTISRSRGTTYGLLACLYVVVATMTAADYASAANPKSTKLSQADAPTVAALAVPMPIPAPRSAIAAPSISAPLAPAQAQFFTIGEVMAKRTGTAIQLAAVDTGQTKTDANSYAPSVSNRSKEPFGLFTFVAPDGVLWGKWRKLETEMRAEEPDLARCLADANRCSPAAARFGAIINDARNRSGRDKIQLVNERVNAAIRFMGDQAQWSVADVWTAPLATFATQRGDCEDYAIAKYVALRQSGVSADDLQLLLVRDNAARADHAVVAARHEGRWLILDNRVPQLLLTADLPHFLPLFVLNDRGVSLFAAPYAAKGVASQG